MSRKDFNYYLKDEDLDNYIQTINNLYTIENLAEEYRILREKYIELGNRLSARITVERAKDVVRDKFLKDNKICTGDDAMHYIRKIACNKNLKFEEVCQLIIDFKEML